MKADETASALGDVRVLEIGTMVAGPFAGTLLGDFGADVIKIEAPTGDTMRHVQPIEDGQSYYWSVDARNKRSFVCDLRAQADRAAFLDLVEDADIIVENFRPGTLEKWGIGPDALLSRNPDIVILRVSGFGQTGARAHLPAFDRVIQAMSGYAGNMGVEGDPPLAVGSFLSDYCSALFGAFGAMLALHGVRRGLGGQVVDVASLDVLVRLSEIDLPLKDRQQKDRPRLGSGHLAAAPMGAYRAADGEWVMMHVPTDRMFANLVGVMDAGHLTNDPRFASNPKRTDNRRALDAEIDHWAAGRTADEAVAQLLAADVPAAKVERTGSLAEDPSLHDRGTIVRASSPLGEMLMPGIVPLLSRTPGRVRTAASAVPGPAIAEASWQAGSDR